jgi:transposase
MTTLADDPVPDELWAIVAPLLPTPPRPSYGGRHRVIPERNCFAAIVFMARTFAATRPCSGPWGSCGCRLKPCVTPPAGRP